MGTCTSTTNPCTLDSDCAFGNTCDPPNQYTISESFSLSNRFYVNNNMALEALKIYAEAISENANAQVVLNIDDNGMPGEELFSWNVNVVQETNGNNYFLILTTDQCIYLEKNNYYWLSLHASDSTTEIAWYHSFNNTYTYSTSSNQGNAWEGTFYGNCGSLSIWAESIYEPEIFEAVGDINMDGGINVLDVVLLSNSVLNDESISGGDLNNDGSINVLDIVNLVNTIITGGTFEQLPVWDYIDINPNSNFFEQLIGPETFSGNVSVYYFGKAG
jgi:hypothetical protein